MTGRPALTVVTDDPTRLPEPTTLPVLDLNQVDAVATFLLANADRCHYTAPPC